MLTLDLRALEKAGLVQRTIYPGIPPLALPQVIDQHDAPTAADHPDGRSSTVYAETLSFMRRPRYKICSRLTI